MMEVHDARRHANDLAERAGRVASWVPDRPERAR